MLDELRKKAKLYDDLQNKLGGMDPDTLAKKLKDLEKL
jgi:DNA-binding HxlR family transcriptional regulator